MDARDIKQEVPEILDGKYLERIYDLQKELIEPYIRIEGLPNYPIDVNTKKSQSLIKDMVGRVIEELAEGYESMLLIDDLMLKNKNFLYDYSDDDLSQCINHLQNCNEEFADAIHFMVELLIYININPQDIDRYIDHTLNKPEFRGLKDKWEGQLFPVYRDNVIFKAMWIGNTLQQSQNYGMLTYDINLLDTAEREGLSISDINIYQAASHYGISLYEDFKKSLWDITYHLNIARNFLKNKPWKQSQMMTDEIRFQEEMVKAFINMMGTFSIIGWDDKTLFYNYFKKNCINKFRQQSNY